ncbi:E3 ubiquitin-protein ligase PUB22-like [Salvia miltiorrhiza]|uniref:E3 ubiquitin-protein ligase PUB22-like n=1 Tax=Salvia miltiorrhiza TaxID=226208 RepID=UPI0025ABD233|nr:E3 ubiquitin-protein ligase PUB22-like [Salvia miltiorrhiza]
MEEEEIPCFFLCPISMQLMSDPVTVSTGITYDRRSIEKWLLSCRKTTCPVTNQPLDPAAALTPNHTLLRLIQARRPKPELPDSGLKPFFAENSNNITSKLIQVLRDGDSGSRGGAVALLRDAYAAADRIHLIGAGREVFVEAVRVMNDGISARATKSAVKLLAELCPWGRNRLKAVEGGAVGALIELLLETGDRRACELALTALDQLCGCAEGRAELLRHGAGLAVVSKKILRVSAVATDKGVRIVGSISRYSANSRVVEEMVQVGVVSKLCLVLQLQATHKTKERVREILMLHSRVWKESSCIPSHFLSFYPS